MRQPSRRIQEWVVAILVLAALLGAWLVSGLIHQVP
jgi:hypothetical protein